ncbi:DUF397 domain-containing protein [Streptomyces sp. SID14478]|uniref:DUF397 domain-containing protein n=1 Tax=Streptomyces sp. SID14478 TaxID=2706073 RepID=UPI0013DB8D59|nr:DUF397 domain-containing protein [Streptomyces sp. SID14478]NEB78615.1 DUF397 domain-containing protein [Streptomyces sp. SID14478]
MSTARHWFKSSYSGSEGGDCLEVAYDWQKPSRSSDEPTAIHIRDSKNPEGPCFTVAPGTWTAFLNDRS